MAPMSINAMTCPGGPSGITQLKFLYVAVWQKMDWSGINEEQPWGSFFKKTKIWDALIWKESETLQFGKYFATLLVNIPETHTQSTSKSQTCWQSLAEYQFNIFTFDDIFPPTQQCLIWVLVIDPFALCCDTLACISLIHWIWIDHKLKKRTGFKSGVC